MFTAKVPPLPTVSAILLLLAAASVPRSLPPQTAPGNDAKRNADLILINGKIITADAKDSIAQAVAVQDGKIVVVGSNEEAQKYALRGARIIDLHGRTATPGLIDTHCHFDETATIYDIDLSNVKNISEIVELVRQKVAHTPPNLWVRGTGWDESKLCGTAVCVCI